MSRKERCPQGHSVTGKAGACTPVYCAKEKTYREAKPAVKAKVRNVENLEAVNAGRRRSASAAPVPVEESEPAGNLAVVEDERFDEVLERGRETEFVHKRLGVPTGLVGGEAEDWADKRLGSLLPLAVAEYERALRFGDQKARLHAADRITDATGRGKREVSGQAGPAIVIQMVGGGPIQLPWRTQSPTIEASAAPPALPPGDKDGEK